MGTGERVADRFQRADRRYAELKRRYDSGSLSAEEMDARLEEMMVQDEQNRWWAKARETGEWMYHDGSAWVLGTPPAYQQAGTATAPDPQQGLPGPQQGSGGNGPSYPPEQSAAAGDGGSRALPWVLGGLALLAVLAFVVLLAGVVIYYASSEVPEPKGRAIEGTTGKDTLEGSAGDDEIYGYSGDDTIKGGTGDDEIYGYANEDALEGGVGEDYIFGMQDNDTIYADDGERDIINCGGGTDRVRSDSLDEVADDCEERF